MPLPKHVRIVEVGPRDGLQNEKQLIDIDTKVALIDCLANAGFTHIEAGSFVNPKWVPQMADSAAVFQKINRRAGVSYAALTPNIKGFERAIKANATEVAIFASASESFSQKNIN
ncbi:MAG: hydroxymethylglutaryl-CoA lyase, partial [Cellvibrionales bacterium]|nr:hydroxymethylglutaryl-CoA lyase [Cellvibrionales bacterium]